jgi:hypothetical protein
MWIDRKYSSSTQLDFGGRIARGLSSRGHSAIGFFLGIYTAYRI